MDFSVLLDKNFKADHVKAEPKVLTVARVAAAEVGRNKELKPVAYFVEDVRGLVLNKTNFKNLAKAHGGFTDSDVWVGARVQLSYNPDVEFGGATVGGIKLKVLEASPMYREKAGAK